MSNVNARKVDKLAQMRALADAMMVGNPAVQDSTLEAIGKGNETEAPPRPETLPAAADAVAVAVETKTEGGPEAPQRLEPEQADLTERESSNAVEIEPEEGPEAQPFPVKANFPLAEVRTGDLAHHTEEEREGDEDADEEDGDEEEKTEPEERTGLIATAAERTELARRIYEYDYRPGGVATHVSLSEEAYSRLMDFILEFDLNRKKTLTCVLDLYLPRPTASTAHPGRGEERMEAVASGARFGKVYRMPGWVEEFPDRAVKRRVVAFQEDPWLRWKFLELSKRSFPKNTVSEALVRHLFAPASMIYPVRRRRR